MIQEKQDNSRIFGLDIVRAIAILLVLVSHTYYLLDSNNPILILLCGLLGYSGVELFFVLSGFLIGSILLKIYISDQFSIQNVFSFLKRRWLRTLPNYYLVLILNIVIGYVLNYQMDSIWRYFLFLQNFSSYSISFFSESWSLSIEEWTYILIPFLLFFSFKIFKTNKKFGFLFTIVLLILLFHLTRYFFFQNGRLIDMQKWNNELKSIVIYRIDSILYGFIISWFNHFYANTLKNLSVYLFILGVHLFFIQFVVLNVLGFDLISSPLFYHVFYFTASSIIFSLVIPVFIYWKTSHGFFSKIFTWISKLSYSTYLLHYSLVTVVLKYFINAASIMQILVLYFSSTFFLAYVLYRFFEKPIMDFRA